MKPTNRIRWREGDKVDRWARTTIEFYDAMALIGFVCRDENDADEIALARRLLRQYGGKK